MKQSKLFLLPILLVAALTGCKKESGSGVKITIWEDDSNISMVKELCDEFIADYRRTYPDSPKITVEILEHQEKSAISDLASGIAESGEGPDIAAVTHDTIASGVGNQIVAPAMFADSVKARMTAQAVNAVTYEDVVYGYPITAESMTVMYDKRQISAAQLESLATLLASGKKLGFQLRGDNAGYYQYGLYTDSVLFGADGKDPHSVEIATTQTVENVTNFYNTYKGCFEDALPEVAYNYISSGRVAGIITTPFMLESMKNLLGDNLGVAKLPRIAEGVEMRPFSGYKAYVVSKYSKNAAIAHALCNYITDYDAQAYRLFKKGYLPACPLDATEEIAELVAASETATVYAASLANSIVMPNIPEMSNFWIPMNNASTYFYEASSLSAATVTSKLNEVKQSLLGN